MIDGALVLEGGSLRCLFTSGVLDVMLENGIEMSYVNGISAGSMCGLNYVSRQIGRMKKINMEYIHDDRYISFRKMLKSREVFNLDFLLGELSKELIPFDFEAFENSPQRYETAATSCKTGKTVFFEKGVCSDIFAAVKASASMPLLSKMVTVEGEKYLDGCVSLPIAYERAIEQGYEKVVLVLTREDGYRKKPLKSFKRKGYEHYFGPLPEFLDALLTAPDRYNRMQEEIDQLEKDGRIFVIRPFEPVKVSRLERNKHKLEALYGEGRRVCEDRLEALKDYLEIK